MKRITLLRHAQAEAALAGQMDFDRVLTRRGAEDAAEMARRFRLRKLPVDALVSSTAPRAYITAEIFARTLKLPANHLVKDDRLYTAGPGEFLAVARERDNICAHLFIAAHNPGITDFADKLSAERGIDAMPTCALVMMRFEIASWKELAWHSGVDVELDYPDRAA